MKTKSGWHRDDTLSDEENERRLMAFLKTIKLPEKPNYPNPMLPPWEACPDIPMFSIGWRMGGGEDYMHAFSDWFSDLDTKTKNSYIENNPEPSTWKHWWLLQTKGIEAYKAAETADRGGKT